MPAFASPLSSPDPAKAGRDGRREFTNWTLHEFASVRSTNLEARDLPPWHAVRADTQTGGYGRTGRAWVSDAGGLWLSAVLPTPGPAARWAILPLAVGWVVIQALDCIGVKHLRLRWPNDIMIGPRKLAGLLLERFSPDAAVIGLGLNVANQPASDDPTLAGAVTTLHELIDPACTLDEVTALMLRALRHVHRILLGDGFSGIAADLNARGFTSTDVELTLAHQPEPLRGLFRGIDETGRVYITTGDGVLRRFVAHEVAHLRELS